MQNLDHVADVPGERYGRLVELATYYFKLHSEHWKSLIFV
jgi:hypothetical protein